MGLGPMEVIVTARISGNVNQAIVFTLTGFAMAMKTATTEKTSKIAVGQKLIVYSNLCAHFRLKFAKLIC